MKIIILTILAIVNGLENYGQYVNKIYKKVGWKFSDQRLLLNFGGLYQKYDDSNRKEGGFWRVFREMFESTQNLKTETFQRYYTEIR